MQQRLMIFCFVISFGYYIDANVLYECNFDNATLNDHCFTTSVLILSGLAILSDHPPDSPLSDVTSSLKPTKNEEVCKLPFKVRDYTWDMYFCYKGYCPTENYANSTCQSGQFAGVQLLESQTKSFQLKTESGGINGIDEQHLTYYYYISNVGQKSITVRKEEIDGTNEDIDFVTSSPFNGWIKRQITFNVMRFGYKLYFDLQKTVFETSLIDIGLDEISIHQGGRREESTIETMTSNLIDITTSGSIPIMETTQITTTTSSVISMLTTISMDNHSMTTPVETTISITSLDEQSTATTDNAEYLTTTATSIIVSNSETVSASLSSDVDMITANTESTTASTIRSTIIHIDRTYSEASSTATHDESSAQQPTKVPITLNVLNSTTISSQTTTISRITTTNATILSNNNAAAPFNKTYIIVLSTVVPIILIVIIGIIIKIKRSSSRRSSAKTRRRFIDINHHPSSSNDFELEPTQQNLSF